ncbi:unnamed protein product, partial [marine sediment metagenome]
PYDRLLTAGYHRIDARAEVGAAVRTVLEEWEGIHSDEVF